MHMLAACHDARCNGQSAHPTSSIPLLRCIRYHVDCEVAFRFGFLQQIAALCVTKPLSPIHFPALVK